VPANKSGTRRYVILPLRGLTEPILASLPRELGISGKAGRAADMEA
jgi:hypothetical protein